MKKLIVFAVCAMMLTFCSPVIKEDENLLMSLMTQKPEFFSSYIANKDTLDIQIIYTIIDRDENNNPTFRSFYFNVDSSRYFYPASTVKLPMSLVALEKINQLNIPGLDRNTPMFSDSTYSGQLSVKKDTTSETGLPSIEHYVKKILVVSDNDAHNRLYELVGQQATNEILHKKGYHVRFLHRLERALSPDQNRHTEAVRFIKEGKVVYKQAMLVNQDSIQPQAFAFRGKGFMKDDTMLINEPFNFTYKNFYSLADQQKIVRAVLFPETVDSISQFNLTESDYELVRKYMSQLPTETLYPPYSKDPYYYDAYCKFLMYGNGRERIPDHIRIFNKVGDAYGYLLDNAYIVDFKNEIEFMLSAVINTNVDGIYNDGKYAYDSLGYPFMKNLGQLVYEYELKRKRVIKPDLSKFVFTYDLKRP